MIAEELLQRYIEQPGTAAARSLQRAIVADPTFDPASGWYPRAEALVAADRHDEAIRRIDAHMPGALLCPQAHAILSHSLGAIARYEEAARERELTAISLHLILDSGDGSLHQPWQVLRILDEYAVLRTGSQRPIKHRNVSANNRQFDVHVFADGTEQWFELIRS